MTAWSEKGENMIDPISYEKAGQILLDAVTPVRSAEIAIEDCAGYVLAEDIIASADVPPFDRSPYDGYAFRAADTMNASWDNPVTLRILEEIPAGGVSHIPVSNGTAVKILTGAPVPSGADAVIMFEKTEFTDETVTLFSPVQSGDNVIYAGEDVKKGSVLAEAGTRIDAGLCGTIASQNIPKPKVFEKPKIGIISTGSELLEAGEELLPGKIINSNRYTLSAEVLRLGMLPVWIGTAGDSAGEICDLIQKALEKERCDAVILTGGVSVGDYDFTPQAMEMAGAKILVHGVKIKPGMACAYGTIEGKLICGLSGNPASSLTNFHVLAAPALRKLCGLREEAWKPAAFPVSVVEGFQKASPGTRFLRGHLDLSDGTARMHLSADQGNIVLSSAIGADMMAVIPAGSGPVAAGDQLTGFLL